MQVRFDEIDAKLRYKLMTAAIIPRPVALVTTLDRDGNANAAPYSFFNGMSEDPPLVVLGLKRRDSGPKKDTARNIEETGEFVAHLVTWQMHKGMLVTAADFPEGVDEIPLAGFSTAPSTVVKPPRLAEAPIAFECKKYVTVQAGVDRDIAIGEIVAMHVDDKLWDAERQYIDWQGNMPIARLWGTLYAPLGEAVEGPVPDPAGFE
ncbi:MAG: flavin reductase family protein [Pseudomonadota bacterium]